MSTSPRPPRTAIFGSTGTVGRALAAAHLALDPQTLAVARSGGDFRLDLNAFAEPGATLPSGLAGALRQRGISQAILCGGQTRIATCEDDPTGTRRVNVDGTLRLAEALSGLGLVVLWFSSDYVFDGLAEAYPDDAPLSPLNEYGRQKAEVERRLPQVCGGECLILRLGKVYATTPGDGSLLAEMAALLCAGREVRAASDQIFCQVHADDMAAAVLALQAANARGVVNLCAPGARSRLDIARLVAKTFGAPESLVREISLDDLGERFMRPKRVVLEPRRLAELLPGLRFRTLDEAVRELAAGHAAGDAA